MLTIKNKLAAGRWALLAAIVLFLGLFAILRFTVSPRIYIGYYALPASVQESLTKNIKIYLARGNSKRTPVVVSLDDTLPLYTALQTARKKCDMVVSYNGRNLEDLLSGKDAGRAKAIDSTIYAGMTINIRKLAQYNGKDLMVPLLTDHFEAAFSRYWLDKTKRDVPETMSDFMAYIDACNAYSAQNRNNAKARVLQWDVFLAASDPDTLLQFTGAYLESAYGIQACRALENAIRDGKPFGEIAREPLDADGHTLSGILDAFKGWESESLVHPQWTALTLNDVKQFMKTETAPVAFIPLSVHRAIDTEIIVNYSASFFPVMQGNEPKSFTAPVICAAQLTKNGTIADILRYLTSQDAQATLSMETGLAPVNSRAVAPDRESDDVRYWTAATESPYPGLDKAAFVTPADRKAFADQMILYIRTPK